MPISSNWICVLNFRNFIARIDWREEDQKGKTPQVGTFKTALSFTLILTKLNTGPPTSFILHNDSEHIKHYVSSGLQYKVDENCTLVGYYKVSSGNFLQESRIQKVSWPLKMGLIFSQNISKKLPLLTV